MAFETTISATGTVRYWDVYARVWVERHCRRITDHTLSTLGQADRDAILAARASVPLTEDEYREQVAAQHEIGG